MKLSNFIVQESATIFEAAAAIDENGRQIVFVCDSMRLLASFTDGDLRRYLLRAGDLMQPIKTVAKYTPTSLPVGEQHRARQLIAKKPYMRGIPIIDARGDIVSIEFPDNATVHRNIQLNVPVVIMAGGRGTRLAPYTNVLPKPLIPIGDVTITEHIIDRFLRFGCDDFTMIVNHKKGLIKAYFHETPCKGKLHFVEENSFQGTGGGLKLLDGMFNSTFFMTNCDVLIEADYEDLLRHHQESGAMITMVCALKKVSVSYGTVELNQDGKPVKLIEKPEYPLLVNTGLYVIEPSFIETIPSGLFIHITELIQQLIDDGKPVSVYPIGEAGWLDMGQVHELRVMEEALAKR